MLFMMSNLDGRYLNVRLKNYAFPNVDENNKNGCMSAGQRDAWKRAKVCSIQWQPPDAFTTLGDPRGRSVASKTQRH